MQSGAWEPGGQLQTPGASSLIKLHIEDGNYRAELVSAGLPEQSWLYPSEESVLDFLMRSLHLGDEEARVFAQEACVTGQAQREVELSDDDIRAISAPTE